MSKDLICRFCSSQVNFFSKATVFRQEAGFDFCQTCGSVQITDVPWLEEAHFGGIVDTDTGAAMRSIDIARNFTLFMHLEKKFSTMGIDYGGGSGLLTRLLRDRGFRCLSFDPYANQFFASGFIATAEVAKSNSTFLLAIECIEHLEDPFSVFENFVSNKDYFLFTTELISDPPPNPAAPNPWWYFSLESGQHVSFASFKGLEKLQKRLGFPFYTRINGIHIFSRIRVSRKTKLVSRFPRVWLLYSTYVDLRYRQRFTLTEIDSLMLKKKKF